MYDADDDDDVRSLVMFKAGPHFYRGRRHVSVVGSIVCRTRRLTPLLHTRNIHHRIGCL